MIRRNSIGNGLLSNSRCLFNLSSGVIAIDLQD